MLNHYIYDLLDLCPFIFGFRLKLCPNAICLVVLYYLSFLDESRSLGETRYFPIANSCLFPSLPHLIFSLYVAEKLQCILCDCNLESLRLLRLHISRPVPYPRQFRIYPPAQSIGTFHLMLGRTRIRKSVPRPSIQRGIGTIHGLSENELL